MLKPHNSWWCENHFVHPKSENEMFGHKLGLVFAIATERNKKKKVERKQQKTDDENSE